MNTSNSTTVTIGGPCGECDHAHGQHERVCAEAGDLRMICIDCIDADWCRDEESCRPAFHEYVLTPLVIRA